MFAWITGVVLFISLMVWSTPTSKPSFKTFFQPIKVQVNKKQPPTVAFEDSLKAARPAKKSIFDEGTFVSLQTEEKKSQTWSANRTVILASMMISREEASRVWSAQRWMTSLSTPAMSQTTPISQGFGSKTVYRSNNPKEIIGHLEIQGGLAVLNTSRIEVRRVYEGVAHDLGTVNIHDGTYAIELSDRRGLLVGKLIDQNEKVWGEGQIYLEQVPWQNFQPQQGPELRIAPRLSQQHVLNTPYTNRKDKTPAPRLGSTAYALNGGARKEISKDGKLSFEEISEKSTTLVRYVSDGYEPTQQIFNPEMADQSMIVPTGMMGSLKAMVSEQKQYNLYDPEAPVIWGQVLRDGHPMEGLRVEIENHAEFEVIYFNEFYLPDSNRTTTSKNGYFAIIDPPKGFQSLIAYQGDSLFSYQNTIVDEGVVSYVEMQNTMKSKDTSVKVFNAFTGNPEQAVIQMQSVLKKQTVNQQSIVRTQQISRMAVLQASPAEEFINADYLYNENDEFIHIPLFQKNWVGQIMQQERISQSTERSILIGLVPDDDFEISTFFDGQENSQVVYFDSRGEIIKGTSGKAGGGFILFNAPPDVFELGVVLDKNKEEVLSKVFPARPGEFLVTSFRD